MPGDSTIVSVSVSVCVCVFVLCSGYLLVMNFTVLTPISRAQTTMDKGCGFFCFINKDSDQLCATPSQSFLNTEVFGINGPAAEYAGIVIV